MHSCSWRNYIRNKLLASYCEIDNKRICRCIPTVYKVAFKTLYVHAVK